MSENLELVRSIYAVWEHGDFSSAEWADLEIEATWVDGPSPGTWTGRDRMAQGMRDVVNVWDGFRVEAEEFRELDAERVFVSHRTSARGKASGVDLNARGAALLQVRDMSVQRLVIYWNCDRALADLGLRPARSPDS
jgi:ketosteroid isomerase-like protein